MSNPEELFFEAVNLTLKNSFELIAEKYTCLSHGISPLKENFRDFHLQNNSNKQVILDCAKRFVLNPGSVLVDSEKISAASRSLQTEVDYKIKSASNKRNLINFDDSLDDSLPTYDINELDSLHKKFKPHSKIRRVRKIKVRKSRSGESMSYSADKNFRSFSRLKFDCDSSINTRLLRSSSKSSNKLSSTQPKTHGIISNYNSSSLSQPKVNFPSNEDILQIKPCFVDLTSSHTEATTSKLTSENSIASNCNERDKESKCDYIIPLHNSNNKLCQTNLKSFGFRIAPPNYFFVLTKNLQSIKIPKDEFSLAKLEKIDPLYVIGPKCICEMCHASSSLTATDTNSIAEPMNYVCSNGNQVEDIFVKPLSPPFSKMRKVKNKSPYNSILGTHSSLSKSKVKKRVQVDSYDQNVRFSLSSGEKSGDNCLDKHDFTGFSSPSKSKTKVKCNTFKQIMQNTKTTFNQNDLSNCQKAVAYSFSHFSNKESLQRESNSKKKAHLSQKSNTVGEKNYFLTALNLSPKPTSILNCEVSILKEEFAKDIAEKNSSFKTSTLKTDSNATCHPYSHVTKVLEKQPDCMQKNECFSNVEFQLSGDCLNPNCIAHPQEISPKKSLVSDSQSLPKVSPKSKALEVSAGEKTNHSFDRISQEACEDSGLDTLCQSIEESQNENQINSQKKEDFYLISSVPQKEKFNSITSTSNSNLKLSKSNLHPNQISETLPASDLDVTRSKGNSIHKSTFKPFRKHRAISDFSEFSLHNYSMKDKSMNLHSLMKLFHTQKKSKGRKMSSQFLSRIDISQNTNNTDENAITSLNAVNSSQLTSIKEETILLQQSGKLHAQKIYMKSKLNHISENSSFSTIGVTKQCSLYFAGTMSEQETDNQNFCETDLCDSDFLPKSYKKFVQMMRKSKASTKSDKKTLQCHQSYSYSTLSSEIHKHCNKSSHKSEEKNAKEASVLLSKIDCPDLSKPNPYTVCESPCKFKSKIQDKAIHKSFTGDKLRRHPSFNTTSPTCKVQKAFSTKTFKRNPHRSKYFSMDVTGNSCYSIMQDSQNFSTSSYSSMLLDKSRHSNKSLIELRRLLTKPK